MSLEFWKRLPIRRQLMLAVNGLLLMVVVLFLIVGHGLRIRDAKQEKRIALVEEAKTIYESVDAIANRGNESIQQLIDDVCARMNTTESPGHHIAVEWQGSSMQAKSHGRASHDMFQAMRAASRGGSGQPSDSHALVVAKFEGPLGTIYISEAEESVLRNARHELLRQIVAVLLAGALAGLMVNLVLRRVVTKPLRRLVTTLGRIGDGDLDPKAEERSCEELSYLSEQVNAMTKKLAAADRDRRLHMKKARDIQQNLRPTNGKVRGIDTAELFEPADDVGGDYYDVIPLGEYQCLLCLADVSGHGVPAAMAATVIKALVLEAVEVTNSPAEILNRINRRYAEIIIEGHFATMVVVLVDRQKMTLTCSNAGHEHPFIQESGKTVHRLQASDLLLGVDESVTYAEETVPVASGTRIVLVSDGVTEMFDQDETQFGTERVRQVMENSSATDVRQLVDDFSKALARFRQSRPPFDDTTLLAAELTSM
ncbi:Phosphoserine phosphatase RsbU [Stieleria maiorica]|uniref:Phosphoserine phosphatase RsbU n=1 Tax=Stieleria maiorica TaxID=2795974 RepID=A0A5B9MJU6_9BACT|nr:SpoIIE family protein phosphatase [Stieleria maiorica]QEG01489.1 Phosphoserine phosphatase RsbU [Stieleria maiorica]